MIEPERISRLVELAKRRRIELQQRRADLTALSETAETLEKEDALLRDTLLLLTTLTERVYGDAVTALRASLDRGIAAAYPRGVSSSIQSGTRSGRPELQIGVSLQDGNIVSPRSAHGGGLAAIMGLLARAIVITAGGYRRLMILDEPFSAVSEDLQDLLSLLVKSLARDLGFQFIIVSHEKLIASHADVVYEVIAPGKITKRENPAESQ